MPRKFRFRARKNYSICWASVLSSAEWHRLNLVVCDGTKNNVNHFYAGLWIKIEALKIRTNLFGSPTQSTCKTIKKLEGIKLKNEWISAIDSYLTLRHQSLYKEEEIP